MMYLDKKRKKAVLFLLVGVVFVLFPGRFLLPKVPVLGPYFAAFYTQIEVLSLFKQPGFFSSKVPLYYPEGKATYSTTAVRSHFREKKQDFVLLAADTSFYVSPTENTEVNIKLPIGARVKVTYTLPSETWSFVVDPETNAPLGWCPDWVLGYQDRFSMPSLWDLPYVGFCIGEYCAEFELSQTGSFVMTWEAVGQGLALSGRGDGQVYTYKHLVWMKQNDSGNLDELFIRGADGKLVHEMRRRDEPIRFVKPTEGDALRQTKKSVFNL